MKVTLDFTERMQLIGVLNGFKGALNDTAVVMDDLKGLNASKEEGETAGLSADSGKLTWNPEKAKEVTKEVELSDASLSYFRKWVEDKDKKGEFTLSDTFFIGLRDKL